MLRILLDECLPVKLKYRFQESDTDFNVSTVTTEQWTGIQNGELLSLAQQRFDVFITVDQQLPYHQRLSKYSIAIVALKATSNRYKDLLKFVGPASEIIKTAEECTFYEVTLDTE